MGRSEDRSAQAQVRLVRFDVAEAFWDLRLTLSYGRFDAMTEKWYVVTIGWGTPGVYNDWYVLALHIFAGYT